MSTILITGGAGFIGSNFVRLVSESNPDDKLIVLDKLTYAGSLDNFKSISDKKYEFVKGSICDNPLVEDLFSKYRFNKVINFAAETHVDNSIIANQEFINSNINGTHTLLDVAKNHWLTTEYKLKDEFLSSLFVQISTDEVYGSLTKNEKSFDENSPYRPNSPYSASKASADLLVRSYHQTYGLNTIITNCSNNFGPNQHQEKLIPKVISCCLNKNNIPLYGKGENIREWIYVDEHNKALLKIMQKGKVGESYCIGSQTELSNLELVTAICNEFSDRYKDFDYKKLITFVKDRPGHDFRYSTNSEKIKKLNIMINDNFKDNIRKTIDFYIKRFKDEANPL